MSDLKYKTVDELNEAKQACEKNIKNLSSKLAGQKERLKWIEKYLCDIKEEHWFRKLKPAGPTTGNKYYIEEKDDSGGAIWFSDQGDGIFVMDITSNRKNAFPRQYVEMMNVILSDSALRELVALRLETLDGKL